MTRRSTKLMRLESSLYTYNKKKESWDIKEINLKSKLNNNTIFEKGSFFSSKHMSQKVNPISYRLGNNKTWSSTWFSDYKYFNLTHGKFQKDYYIREYIESVFKELGILIDKVYIKEINNIYIIKVYLYESGLNNKKDIIIPLKRKKRFLSYLNESTLKSNLNPFFKLKKKGSTKFWVINPKKVISHIEHNLNTYLETSSYLSLVFKGDIGDSASLFGKYLLSELEKPNTNFKKGLRNTLIKVKSTKNIRGLRVNCSGRLGRAPMAKMEWFKYGSIPLTKISANIDYIDLNGSTKYGSFGLKIWLYKT